MIANLLDYLRTRRKRVAEVCTRIEIGIQCHLLESTVQRSHSPSLCQRIEQLNPRAAVKSYMLHSQTIVRHPEQTRFAAEVGELARQMILAADAGQLHVLNADLELDVDPWVTLDRKLNCQSWVL